ncbi:MAG: hypothetical protein NXI11_00885 [Proteobacteria bacterium]|nr:hypothetical protein [Pseudomonadota bacterium]
MLVPTCPEGDTGSYNPGLGNNPTATCDSGFVWVDIYAPGDAINSLDPQLLAGAFGAGFVVLGTGLVIVMAGRLILDAIRKLPW